MTLQQSSVSQEIQRSVMRSCKQRGLLVQPNALQIITEYYIANALPKQATADRKEPAKNIQRNKVSAFKPKQTALVVPREPKVSIKEFVALFIKELTKHLSTAEHRRGSVVGQDVADTVMRNIHLPNRGSTPNEIIPAVNNHIGNEKEKDKDEAKGKEKAELRPHPQPQPQANPDRNPYSNRPALGPGEPVQQIKSISATLQVINVMQTMRISFNSILDPADFGVVSISTNNGNLCAPLAPNPAHASQPAKKRYMFSQDSSSPTSISPESVSFASLSASSKAEVFRNRYMMLYSRLIHQTAFGRSQTLASKALLHPGHHVGDYSSSLAFNLTKTEALIGGCKGIKYVFGMMVMLEENCWYIEDPFGFVPLDLNHVKSCLHGTLLENNFVVIEGELSHDMLCFQVYAISHPPFETRDKLATNLREISYFGGRDLCLPHAPRSQSINSLGESISDRELVLELEREDPNGRLVILTDFFVDSEQVLESFKDVLHHYQSKQWVPAAFILVGNFLSTPFGRNAEDARLLQTRFDKLGALIARFPVLARKSTFVLIPGHSDPGLVDVLPRMPLPEFFVSGLRKHASRVVCSTNPSRIRLGSQMVVISQDSIYRKATRFQTFARNIPLLQEAAEKPMKNRTRLAAILGGSATDDKEENTLDGENANHALSHVHELIKCLIHQGHLSPLPLKANPIMWQHDQALWLHPTPHALILAQNFEPFTWKYADCETCNPGSFGHKRVFAEYVLAKQECNLLDVNAWAEVKRV